MQPPVDLRPAAKLEDLNIRAFLIFPDPVVALPRPVQSCTFILPSHPSSSRDLVVMLNRAHATMPKAQLLFPARILARSRGGCDPRVLLQCWR